MSHARLEWTDQALSDLDAIFEYLKEHTPEFIESQLNTIITAVSGLITFPGIGRPGRVAGTRELVVLGTPYIAAYIEDPQRVVVIAVIHGARRWPKRF